MFSFSDVTFLSFLFIAVLGLHWISSPNQNQLRRIVYTKNMKQLRFGTITTVLYIVCGIFMMIDYTHTASVKNKDDNFNINITMAKFNTTQVIGTCFTWIFFTF